MSRIPIPTHNTRAPSPALSFPERLNSTSTSSVQFSTNAAMSSLSGFQSSPSLSETRKKQSKRDEVSFILGSSSYSYFE